MTSITDTDIGIIILAAGSSQRYGSDKRTATLSNGTALLSATLANVPDSFTRRVLVLKKEDEDLGKLYADNWQICHAANPETGMASSLVSGITMAGNWPAALIGLGDMPYISTETYLALQQALKKHDIVIPVFKDQRGNPAGFRQRYFDEIMQLQGDQGARSLLEKYKKECFEVEVQDSGIIQDIDTPEMLRK
ncbi:MAG: nucleotidyltransferase family protein [Gammaproteobacteria bacterium]|nr:nucleotidyltransferase family protein [Gammaproteobacteria bacterium]